MLDRALEEKKAIPQDQYLTLELEGILEEPKTYAKIIMDFFGIEYKDDFIELSSVFFNKELAHIDRWRSELSEKEALDIDKNCSKMYKTWKDMAKQSP
jgi:lipoate-protein ligase A